MTITTKYEPGDVVSHIVDPGARGVITAFILRGANHSYEVQWGIERSSWHFDYELIKGEEKREIGLWRAQG